MKDLKEYYFISMLPLVLLILLRRFELIEATSFSVLLFFYALVYRTYTDGKRLADKKLIPNSDIWKMIFPVQRSKLLQQLYLK